MTYTQDSTVVRGPARPILLPVPLALLSNNQVAGEVKRLRWEYTRAYGDCKRANHDLDRACTPSGRQYAMAAVERLESVANRAYDAWSTMRAEARRRGLEVRA